MQYIDKSALSLNQTLDKVEAGVEEEAKQQQNKKTSKDRVKASYI